MAYKHENIIVGAADVYIETADAAAEAAETAWPTLTAGTSARTAFEGSADFDHAGLTSGGVEFAYAPDFGEVEVDQWLDVAKMFKQRQSVTVTTTFAEATLRNLLFAWGQPLNTLTEGATDTDDTTLRISSGALGDEPEERKIAFIGQAPGRNRERVYELDRALSVESSTFSLSRSEASLIPVSLRCLPGNAAGGDYGRIIERAVTA